MYNYVIHQVKTSNRIIRRYFVMLFFFFQAEDGIRDRNVTGVQTCALPISLNVELPMAHPKFHVERPHAHRVFFPDLVRRCRGIVGVDELAPDFERVWQFGIRSEERRVGKECGSGWWLYW